MNRRKFLQAIGLSGIAALLPFSFGAIPKKKETGTYTVKSPSDYQVSDYNKYIQVYENITLKPGRYTISYSYRATADKYRMLFRDRTNPHTQHVGTTFSGEGNVWSEDFSITVTKESKFEMGLVAQNFKHATFGHLSIIPFGHPAFNKPVVYR